MIKYQTEGRLQIDCARGNASPIGLTWMKGDTKARLHGGSKTIEMSLSQLAQLVDTIPQMIHDLYPGEVK